MNKSNLLKIFSILILSIMVILLTTTVNAADSNGFNDITPTLTNNSSTNGTNNASGNTNIANTNTFSNTTNTNKTNTNTNKTTNNSSSIYNNTNLPKTGIGDSLPVVVLVVVFGISAVYAYKKINDYRNI